MSSKNSPVDKFDFKEPDEIELSVSTNKDPQRNFQAISTDNEPIVEAGSASQVHLKQHGQDSTRVTNNRMEAFKVEPAYDTGGSGITENSTASEQRLAEHIMEQLGTIIAGRYRILELLGVGGMGSVFKAEHIMLGSMVAIKILNKDMATNINALKRFSQEAKTANSLQHPNIAAVSDFGLTESGAPYFVMDLIDGQSLAAYIEENGAVEWRKAVDFGIQITDAMAHAHFTGVIHRDLKPANIIISKGPKEEERASIVDFGIAKFADEAKDAQKLTQTGEVFGSPLYMSPEQCTGKPLDSRSDVYSFGCTMYEILTGHVPFHGMNAVQTILMQINDEPPPFKSQTNQQKTGSIPSGIETVVMHCLQKDPANRYSSMDDVKADLQLVKRGLPPTKKSVKRFRLKMRAPGLVQTGIAAAVTTIAVFIGLAYWTVQWQFEYVPWQRDYSAAQKEMDRGDYDQAVMSAHHGVKVAIAKNAPKNQIRMLYLALGDGYRKLTIQGHDFSKESKTAYESAIALCTGEHAAKHKVQAYLGLGDLAILRGDKREALLEYNNALSSFTGDYVDDAQKARVMVRIGVLHENLGQLALAKTLLRDAIKIYRSMDGVNTPALADALDKLSDICKKDNDETGAKQSHDEAETLRNSFENSDDANKKGESANRKN